MADADEQEVVLTEAAVVTPAELLPAEPLPAEPLTAERLPAEPLPATAPRRADYRGGRVGFSPRPARPQEPDPLTGPASGAVSVAPETAAPESAAPRSGATLAQMRRFIKSRPYVPVHELRRRFLIEGMEDEVSPVSTGTNTLYVGLPRQEADFLGDLVKNGEVGCEVLLDPPSPGVVGVFAMRPVSRQ